MIWDDFEAQFESDDQRIKQRIAEDSSAFTRLTGNFYRGELDRTTTWRARLDQTTNWAVILVAAILTWAFSSPDHPHYVILIGIFGVTAFLVMEANRYREYDVWRRRVRMLQEHVLAALYSPGSSTSPDWPDRLGSDLRNPTFTLTFRQALTHRLRRVYIALLLILLAAWFARILLFETAEPWQETAAILGLRGPVVVISIGIFYLIALALTLWSLRGTRVREFQE